MPAPKKSNHSKSLRGRRVRWRPAVTDGHLLKRGFKWGCIPCWQGRQCYSNLDWMCSLIFPIPIYTFFSLSAPFLYLLFSSPSYHFHFYLQLFLYSFSIYLSFAFVSVSLFVAQITRARLESLYSSQDREEIRSIKSFCGMPPPAKWMEMIKSWCSGLQQIPTSSPVQFTLFTIRQNLSEVFCFPCAVLGGEGARQVSQKTLWIWVSNMRLKHSIVLPLSHFLPNNLWALNNLFFPFSASCSSYPPGSSWAERKAQWFGAGLLAGDLFPCG